MKNINKENVYAIHLNIDKHGLVQVEYYMKKWPDKKDIEVRDHLRPGTYTFCLGCGEEADDVDSDDGNLSSCCGENTVDTFIVQTTYSKGESIWLMKEDA